MRLVVWRIKSSWQRPSNLEGAIENLMYQRKKSDTCIIRNGGRFLMRQGNVSLIPEIPVSARIWPLLFSL